jgi:aminopeptidase N
MARQFLFYSALFLLSFSLLAQGKPPKRKAGTKKSPLPLQELVITPEEVKTYRPSRVRTWELLHTSLDITPVFAAKQLRGTARLYLSPYCRTQERLVLDALNFSDISIYLLNGDERTSLTTQYDLHEISIDLPVVYLPGDTVVLEISYTTNSYDLKKNGISYNDGKGVYFIDPLDKNPYKPLQMWTQGQTHSARCWFPTIDSPNERTTQEIYITVPQPYLTLSNGLLVSSTLHGDSLRTDHWQQSLPHPPYLFFLAAGEYVQVEDEPWGEIPIDYYTISGYEQDVQQVFQHTRGMLELFSNLLDFPYPWAKYSQMVSFDFTAGAMENTSASNFYDRLFATRQDLIDGVYDDIIAHELIHQWLGNMVTPESWANLVLSEGFADYSEFLWYDHQYGREAADHRLWQSRRRYLSQATYKDDPIVNFYYDSPVDMFDNIRYEKGGWVLHMLRYYLGDTIFFKGLNKYLTNLAFQSAEVHQFRMAMEAVSGEDLNWFFNQWKYSEGYPQLKITSQYNAAQRELRVDIEQEQTKQGKTVFRFPMAIDIYLPERVQREKITMQQSQQTFYFSCTDAPVFVNFDADKALLCTKIENKTLEQWAAQYQRAPLFADRMEALIGAVNLRNKNNTVQLNKLLLAAMNDGFWAIRKYAAEQIRLAEIPDTDLAEFSKLMLHDPTPQVREMAIVQLGKYNRKKFASLFEEVVQRDSSPLVLSASLSEIVFLDDKKALALATQFDSTRNIYLMSVLGRIYAKAGGEDKLWVMDKMLWLTTYLKLEDNFRFYYEYLRRQPLATFEKGLQVLSDIYLYEETEENVNMAKTTLERLAKFVADKLDDKKVKGEDRATWEAKRELIFQLDL